MVKVARYPKTNILSTFTAGRGMIHGGHAGSSTPVESCITLVVAGGGFPPRELMTLTPVTTFD